MDCSVLFRKNGCLSCNPAKTIKWIKKKEAAETAEANKAAQGAEPAEVPTWEEAAEAEGCFEELPPEDLDPEFGEAEFDEGDGMLDADAHELLKNVFPQ